MEKPEVYDMAAAYWRDACQQLLATSNSPGWSFQGTSCTMDGEPLRDANPILDFSDPSLNKAVRILQEELILGDPAWIHAYMDVRGENNTMRELVIGCVLTESSFAKAMQLIARWITPDITVEDMKQEIDRIQDDYHQLFGQ